MLPSSFHHIIHLFPPLLFYVFKLLVFLPTNCTPRSLISTDSELIPCLVGEMRKKKTTTTTTMCRHDVCLVLLFVNEVVFSFGWCSFSFHSYTYKPMPTEYIYIHKYIYIYIYMYICVSSLLNDSSCHKQIWRKFTHYEWGARGYIYVLTHITVCVFAVVVVCL